MDPYAFIKTFWFTTDVDIDDVVVNDINDDIFHVDDDVNVDDFDNVDDDVDELI